MTLSVEEIRDIICKKYCPDFEFAYFDTYPWTPLKKKIKDCKLALITTGGIHIKTDKPFDIKNKLGDYTYREIPGDVTLDQLIASHPHYDTKRTTKDLNCIFPIDRMRELVNEGILGSLSAKHYSFMGYTPIWQPLVNEYAPQVAVKLKQEGVDIALITYG